MKKLFLVIALLALVAGSALAKTIKVIVSYGNNGSHGQYVAYLYRNDALFLCKGVTNTGFASGTATFDGLPSGIYYARVVCLTNGLQRWSTVKTLYWFSWYGEVRAYF